MSFPIKVAHVITGLNVGGAEMMLFKLLAVTDQREFEPLVISLTHPGRVGERITALGIRVETVDMRRSYRAPFRVFSLGKLLAEFEPDIIQTWMYHADLVGALALRLKSWRPGHRPVLVWNLRQTDLDRRFSRKTTRLVARINALLSRVIPDHIVCCSARTRAIHRALGYNENLMSVIPNGFDLECFRPDSEARAQVRLAPNVPINAPLLGMVARFDPQKDVPNFLQAASLVRAYRSDCHFLCAGQGMERSNHELHCWIEKAGLADAIHLVGPREDVPRVLAALDLLISASAYGEGFPNVIGEAMACGVPCIVTDVGDSALMVGASGASVAPREPLALAEAIMRVLDEGPVRLRSRGELARQLVRTNYELGDIARRYASLYQDLCCMDS